MTVWGCFDGGGSLCHRMCMKNCRAAVTAPLGPQGTSPTRLSSRGLATSHAARA